MRSLDMVSGSSRDDAIESLDERAHKRHFPITGDSFLATELEVLCLWGFISTCLVQRLAYAYKLDQENMSLPVHPRLERLAKLGGSGMYAGNIRRDFFTMLAASVVCMLEPLWIRIPYITRKGAEGNVAMWQSLPIIMPNVLLEHIWQYFPSYFEQLVGADLARLFFIFPLVVFICFL